MHSGFGGSTLSESSKRPSACTVLLASAGEVTTVLYQYEYKPLGVVDVNKLSERLW